MRTTIKFSKKAEKQKILIRRIVKYRVICNTYCASFPHFSTCFHSLHRLNLCFLHGYCTWVEVFPNQMRGRVGCPPKISAKGFTRNNLQSMYFCYFLSSYKLWEHLCRRSIIGVMFELIQLSHCFCIKKKQ